MSSGPLSVSPSRVADFKTCPQLFKFRVLDRLPEPVDPSIMRGSLVHIVLERLYSLPREERTLERARSILATIWQVMNGSEDLPVEIDPEQARVWLTQAEHLLSNYFRLEDPATIEADRVEWRVEHESERVMMRGIIDRLQVLPDGEWILTDYKTGPSPANWRSLDSFFALRFYALVCWRAFGKMPKELRLVQLREPEVLTLLPTSQMLESLERQIEAIGAAIRRAWATSDWRARRGRACNWCPHLSICPAWRKENALRAADVLGSPELQPLVRG